MASDPQARGEAGRATASAFPVPAHLALVPAGGRKSPSVGESSRDLAPGPEVGSAARFRVSGWPRAPVAGRPLRPDRVRRWGQVEPVARAAVPAVGLARAWTAA